MRYINCDVCERTNVPLNDTIRIDGRVYCNSCLQFNYTDKKQLAGKTIDKHIDPTICSSCGEDHNDAVLSMISTYPICAKCEQQIKSRTFPTWVKGFFIFILGVVVFSFFWNWRFYQSFNNINDSAAAFQNSDFETAASLMKLASDEVPEVEDMKILSAYYNGVYLLHNDKSSEAFAEFNKCWDKLPDDYQAPMLRIQAEIGDCFDRKDYNGFLSAAKAFLILDTNAAQSWAGVASAYACIYAQNGQDSSKLLALENLQRAKSMDSTSPESKDYCNRIEYRIYTRDIIGAKEFAKKYPHGWVNYSR